MRHSSIVSALLLLASHLSAQDAAVTTRPASGVPADAPKTRALSDEAFGRVGGDNASGYQILHALDGWDAAEYADAMLISIRANWYQRIPNLPSPPMGQRRAIIDVHVSGNGTVGHMARRVSTGNKAQDNAAWDALRAAGPFRPFPAELHQKTLKLRFHFVYNLPASEERPVCQTVRPGTFRVNSEVTAPRVQNSPDPEFSESARQNKFQGEVELGLTVAEDGQVRDVCVAQSLGEGLDEKSVAAVRNWKFEPGTRQGKAVPVRISVTTNFHLY